MGKNLLIKRRLLELGKTQADLLKEVRERSFPGMAYAQFNIHINHPTGSAQCDAVHEVIDMVLKEWEDNVRGADRTAPSV